jgi:holo-[acyl-carrier protein] synthase
MIIGIGCDLVEHKMTKQLKWESDEDVLKRIFSPKELALYNVERTIKFLAGRFAAKEAVLKCLGCGMQDGISLADIQIFRGELGRPEIKIKGRVKRLSNQMGINTWQLSISHTRTHSLAFVIAQNQSEIIQNED